MLMRQVDVWGERRALAVPCPLPCNSTPAKTITVYCHMKGLRLPAATRKPRRLGVGRENTPKCNSKQKNAKEAENLKIKSGCKTVFWDTNESCPELNEAAYTNCANIRQPSCAIVHKPVSLEPPPLSTSVSQHTGK